MTFLEKSLFNFYDIITRFIINDFETNRNENTMSKKSTETKITKKTKTVRSNLGFEHLYSSAAKCSNPDNPNWHHSVQTSGNLSFSSTLKMYKVFTHNIQVVTLYEQHGSIKRNAFVQNLLINCSSAPCLAIFPQ